MQYTLTCLTWRGIKSSIRSSKRITNVYFEVCWLCVVCSSQLQSYNRQLARTSIIQFECQKYFYDRPYFLAWPCTPFFTQVVFLNNYSQYLQHGSALQQAISIQRLKQKLQQKYCHPPKGVDVADNEAMGLAFPHSVHLLVATIMI